MTMRLPEDELKEQRRRRWLGMLGVAAVMTGLGVAPLFGAARGPLAATDSLLQVAGIILLVGAGAFFGVALAGLIRDALQARPALTRRQDRLSCYKIRSAVATDLARVAALGSAEIGPAHPSADVLRSRHERCPDIVTVIEDARRASKPTVGFVTLYPLTADTVKKMEDGRLATAKNLTARDFADGFDDCVGVYVSMLCGLRGAPRARVVEVAFEVLRAYVSRNPGLVVLLARPATHAGRLLMRQTGFLPIGAGDGIWALPRTQFDKLMSEGLDAARARTRAVRR